MNAKKQDSTIANLGSVNQKKTRKLELEILSLKEEIQDQKTGRLLDFMRNPEIAGNHTIGLCHRCASHIICVPRYQDSLVCTPHPDAQRTKVQPGRHTVQNLLKLSKNEHINSASRHDKYLR